MEVLDQDTLFLKSIIARIGSASLQSMQYLGQAKEPAELYQIASGLINAVQLLIQVTIEKGLLTGETTEEMQPHLDFIEQEFTKKEVELAKMVRETIVKANAGMFDPKILRLPGNG